MKTIVFVVPVTMCCLMLGYAWVMRVLEIHRERREVRAMFSEAEEALFKGGRVKDYMCFYPPLNKGDEGYVPEDPDGCECPSETEDGFECTRHEGHKPPHAAHGDKGTLYATWEDE